MNQWPLLRWVHLVVGSVGLVAFLGTGQFMDRTLDHLVGMPDAPRALYRSAHIYILFAALLNILLGAYLVSAATAGGRAVQLAASLLVIAALGLFVFGFFVETPLAEVERPRIRAGIELALAGVLLHALCGVFMPRAPLTVRHEEAADVGSAGERGGTAAAGRTAPFV